MWAIRRDTRHDVHFFLMIDTYQRKNGVHHGFVESVKTNMKKYGDFKGRASQSEFWWFSLFAAIGVGVFNFNDAAFHINLFLPIFILATLVPFCAAGFRRSHDVGRSGLPFIFAVIIGPILAAISLLLVFVLIWDSSFDVPVGLAVGIGGVVVLAYLGFVGSVIISLSKDSSQVENKYGSQQATQP